MSRYLIFIMVFIAVHAGAQEIQEASGLSTGSTATEQPAALPQLPSDPGSSAPVEGNPAELLELANQHYMNQEFEKAIQLYEQVISSGLESAQLYYNLGNACFKTMDTPRAMLFYERAKLLAPHHEDIDFNIRVARQFIVDNIEELPQPFFVRWRTSVVNMAPADTWARISIAGFMAFLLLLGAFFFSALSWVKRLTFWCAILLVTLSAFSFSFANHQKKALVERNHGIIFSPRVAVKSSPSTTGTDLFLIHEGLKVQITDSLNSWKEIRIPDGNKGWLPDSCVVRI